MKTNHLGVDKNRKSNFELLRIICMLMIICGHLVAAHGYGMPYSFSWYFCQGAMSMCCVAVNIFVLISGYFGIKLNYSKLWRINDMVTFYSVLFLLTVLALGLHRFAPRTDWMNLAPVLTKQYWFITIYFALCLLSPYLNLLVEKLDRKTYQKLLVTTTALFVLLPTIGFVLNFKSITEDAGYGVVNFCYLYLVGRYIRFYYSGGCKRHHYLLLSIVSMVLLAAFHIGYSKFLGFSFNSLFSYDTLFCFCGALGFFLFFRELYFSNKVVNMLSASCLAVYVIHQNKFFIQFIIQDIFNVEQYQGLQYVFLILVAPIAIFLLCALIDGLRRGLLRTINLYNKI